MSRFGRRTAAPIGVAQSLPTDLPDLPLTIEKMQRHIKKLEGLDPSAVVTDALNAARGLLELLQEEEPQ